MSTLPDPQLMADAQSLTVFASAVSQASMKLVNGLDPSTPEYAEIKAYFKENLPKLRTVMDRLEADLG